MNSNLRPTGPSGSGLRRSGTLLERSRAAAGAGFAWIARTHNRSATSAARLGDTMGATFSRRRDTRAHRLVPGTLRLITILLLHTTGMVAAAGDGLVEISARLDPAEGAVPGQRIRLEVTVATPRWFTAGTRIKLPEVPGLILLQNQDFAANATERRAGESWTVQRWAIDVFATQPGTIPIPPLQVSVAVSQSASETWTGTLKTDPLTLTTAIPAELSTLDSWIASPSVSLRQTVDGARDTYPGAAISRRVTIKASDVMAMLLPRIETEAEPLLQTYPEPPVLRNRSNRGSLTATRSDRVTWIATAPGVSEIPGVSVHWWNTDTQQLVTLTTEPLEISISGEPPSEPVSRRHLIKQALWGAVWLCAALLCWYLLRKGLHRRAVTLGHRIGDHCRRIWTLLTGSALPEQLNPGGSPGQSKR